MSTGSFDFRIEYGRGFFVEVHLFFQFTLFVLIFVKSSVIYSYIDSKTIRFLKILVFVLVFGISFSNYLS